jgi:hypothetical protein
MGHIVAWRMDEVHAPYIGLERWWRGEETVGWRWVFNSDSFKDEEARGEPRRHQLDGENEAGGTTL